MRKFLTLLFSLWASVAAANVPCTLPFNLQNNTIADATQVMANYNALVTCLGNAAAAGANLDITSLFGLTTPLGSTFGGTSKFIGGTSTGSANAQAVTVTPNSFALTQGFTASFTAGFTNTSSMTLNINGTGGLSVLRQTPSGTQALAGGELNVNERVTVEYDGAAYQLITVQAQFGGFGAPTTLASAATTELGSVPTHNVIVSGSTTITSFGNTAQINYPMYRLFFTGAPLLTFNATSMQLPGSANIQVAPGDALVAQYANGGNWTVVEYTKASGIAIIPTPVPGLLFGCTLSGGGSTTLTITACTTASDDNLTTQIIGSQYTKTFASWAVGSGNGALDTGSIATNTWYHVFEITRTDTGVVDYLISLSATAPTFPANYTKKRRLGSIKTDGTPNITSFFQNNDTFLWGTIPAADFNAAGSTTAASLTVQTPLGVRTEGIFATSSSSSAGASQYLLSSLDIADTAPSTTLFTIVQINGANPVGAQARVWTNTSAQIRHRGSANISTVTVQTLGWVDPRGRTQ